MFRYGPDFSKSLQHLKLPNDYYFRVKQPLDITAIRERINNGDYDDNILLFERDVLLMFTNAMTMYHRDLDIHGRAQFMMNFATELLTVRNVHLIRSLDEYLLVACGRNTNSLEK